MNLYSLSEQTVCSHNLANIPHEWAVTKPRSVKKGTSSHIVSLYQNVPLFVIHIKMLQHYGCSIQENSSQ